MNTTELKSVLDLHAKWCLGEPDGKRAYLRGAYLRGADLRGAYLEGAYLRGADLEGADLRGADLRGAYLRGADLEGADLRGAYLEGADLRGAYLRGADLEGADLRGADLEGADLNQKTRLPTGERWEEYLSDVVPAICRAGGRELADVATPEHWDCHDWNNCPMSAAFGVAGVNDVPALHRPRVQQFIQLFDARLIPMPEVPAAEAPEAAGGAAS